MVRLTLTAGRQFDKLLDHYIRLDRPGAADRLVAALCDALALIKAEAGRGRPYPLKYHAAERWGYDWIKVHRYWFAYSDHRGDSVLTNILFETADIPGRIAAEDDELIDPP